MRRARFLATLRSLNLRSKSRGPQKRRTRYGRRATASAGRVTLLLHSAEARGWSDFSHGTPVACYHRIDGQQNHAFNRCLGDENPVEGILMNGRQAVEGEGVFAGDG